MLKPGTIIGERYEILETVGAGGMSIVYKAKCHKLNRYVAIKMLKPEFSDDKNFVTKFRVEAQSSACLSHPNIVSVFDVGEDDGMYYIVMELVEGITLKEYISRQGHLSVEQTLNFAAQIAAGIEVAHDNHIIHRDIKPQNIIVSRNGTLKVTDFGIARAATSNTISPTAMGSVHYISPEQARGGYSDERSDIYSLGITMFEMLTGRVPFEGENNVTVALMHIQDEMISPRAYYPDIPASIEKIIFKCTQKRAERRYLTANALIADLRLVATNPYADIEVGGVATYNSNPTVMMTQEELNAIKNSSYQKPLDPVTPVQAQSVVSPLQSQGVVSPLQTQSSQSQIQMPEFGSHRDVSSKLDDIMKDDNFGLDEETRRAVAAAQSIGSPKNEPDEPDDEDDDDEIELEDEMALDPKLEKAVMIGGILVAVIVCIFIMIGISKMTGWFKVGDKDSTTTENTTEMTTGDATAGGTEAEFEMIDVKGMLQEDAETKLIAQGIDFYTIQFEESDTVEAGMVISQSVEPGIKVSASDNLVIVVSSGTQSIPVPDVVGKDAMEAAQILKDAGFETQFAYEYSDDVEKDKVIYTNPDPGVSAPKGSKIIITVSNGKEYIEAVVPNLKGMTKKEAKKALEEAGLELGEVYEEYSDTVEKGKVIRQSTSPNTTVNSGNTVDITISLGPEQKTTTYTATFSGQIDNTGYAFAEGETVTIKLVFKYDDGKVSYTLLEGTYDASSFPLALNNVQGVKNLEKNAGSVAITAISSNGSDVSSYFSVGGVSITYKEVTE